MKNWIILSIPAFFILIGIELAWDAWRKRRGERPVYRLGDALSNIQCGMLEQVLSAALHTSTIGVYVACFELARGWGLPDLGEGTWIAALVGFVGADLAYYWWHRMSHEVNFMWAGHAVHHQSEDYNLSVALRQAWWTHFTAAPFYLPLALAGVPPVTFLAMKSFMILYQFWIHTQAIGRMGPLEAVLNTPSHHRVHHGVNPRYVDKNYAGTFIVWDRLFGTFEPETEPVSYGTVKPLASFDPIWANVSGWAEMIRAARACSRFSDKLRVFFKQPGWRPADQGGLIRIPQVPSGGRTKYDVELGKARAWSALAVFVAALAGSATYLFAKDRISETQGLISAAAVISGIVLVSALLRPSPASKVLTSAEPRITI